ncbi:MAG: VanZ family protein [Tenacibaculum sp.]
MLLIAILITVSIAILSLIKIGLPPIKVNNLDKYEHAFAYFVLSIFWLIALRKTKISNYIVVLGCFFYGIIIEVLQTTLTSYREASLLDAVANSLGVLIALLIFNKVFEKKQAI